MSSSFKATRPGPATTLGTIAAECPESIPVFERFDLDYCCGGGRTLAAACKERHLDPNAVVEAILAREALVAAPERSWADATMSELADHIEQTHHAFLRGALERLKSAFPRVIAAHADRHPELVRLEKLVGIFSADMADHLVREERVLFPWLRRLERKSEIQGGPPWSVCRPIACMVHDHDDAAAALAEMRSLTHGFTPPADACGLYRSVLETLREIERDTHIHIHKENNLLFPAGIRAEDQLSTRSRVPTAARADSTAR